jgi:serine protease Do
LESVIAHLHRRTLLAAAALALLGQAPARADLADVIAAAKPSVVAIGTFNATASPRFGFRGTGFAVGNGSFVVTNFHVLPAAAEGETAPDLRVLLPTAPSATQLRTAQLVAVDRGRDLALLRIDGEPLPPMRLAEPELAREGASIALVGFPIGGVLGFSHVTHRGIIASITGITMPAPTAQQITARAAARMREGSFEILQLDATAYPGNSGGPVLDVVTGQVVGVVNMVLIKGTRESALSSPTGISYAIPARHVRELMAQAR